MRRTSVAFTISLGLHLLVGALFITFRVEPKSLISQSSPVSLRISTVIKQSEAEQPKVIETEPLPTMVPLTPQSPLPKTAQKIKASKPAPLPLTSAKVEDNVSSEMPHEPTLATASVEKPIPSKAEVPSYVALHKDAIAQALQGAKTYPELARKRSIEGVVEVSFTIKPTGEVDALEATSKSPMLSTAAIECVHKAKKNFPLPLEDVTIKVPIVYVLK